MKDPRSSQAQPQSRGKDPRPSQAGPQAKGKDPRPSQAGPHSPGLAATEAGLHAPAHTPETQSAAPEQSSPSLRYSVYDGLSYSVSLGAGETYLSAFGIFLKATPFQIGLLATLPPLLGALLQTFGVWLMERFRQRRHFLVSMSVMLGVIWLPVSGLPLFLGQSSSAVAILIALICLYFALAGFMVPIWNSLIGDLVPGQSRGRYFGLRNKKCGAVVFVSMLAAGQLLHIFERAGLTEFGFVTIFFAAAAGRFMAAYWLKKHDDPSFKFSKRDHFTFWDFLRRARKSNFARFVFFIASVNLAVNFAGPFFAVYLLRELKLPYFHYTIICATTIIAQFLTLQNWGYLCDRFGNKKILNVTAIGVGLSPILWLFSSETFYLVLIHLFIGAAWAGFNLAVSNFLFDAVTPPKRGRCAAYQALVNGVFIVVGALLGGWYVTRAPGWELDFWLLPSSVYFQLFLISGLLRLAAAAFFLPRFSEVRPVEPIAHRKLLFHVIHLRPVSGATFGPLEGNNLNKPAPPSPED